MPAGDSGPVNAALGELASRLALLQAAIDRQAEVEAVRRESGRKDAAHVEEELRVARAERGEMRSALAAIERRVDRADDLVARIAALEARPAPASVADVADEVSARIAKRDAEAAQRRPWAQILAGLAVAASTALSAYAASQAPQGHAPAPRPAVERAEPDMGADR
ncbi:MAG: hypothetical protein ACO4CT_18445 [Planctomycetota bacterium]